ncbi:MAG: hypothetical protein GY805_21845 [Chloroflexi bacterium]|nr:hypothetical protein [Chloroflexota bacterium]
MIVGGFADDVIFSYGGDDFLIGHLGNDTFTAGTGGDRINGHKGIDELLDFEPGLDSCYSVEIGCDCLGKHK